MGDLNRLLERLPKLTDEQIFRIFRDLTDRNSVFESILDSLSIALIIVDKNWKIIQKNKVAHRFLLSGIEDNADVRLSLKEGEISAFVRKTAEHSKTNVSEEFTVARTGGGVKFLNVSIWSYVNNSEISGNIISIEDITQKRSKEILMRRMENMASLTNLAAGMAHEIKNPLGAISIHIQLIQKALAKHRKTDGLLPDEKFLEGYLSVVNEEIENLNKLVMDFLFAVRPVKAELMLKNPDDILKNLVDFFSPEFNKNHVVVSLSVSEKTVRILIDEKLFREIVMNIAQNAFAAVKERYPECAGIEEECLKCPGRIEFNSYIKEDRYILNIADNGIGMTEEVVSRLFEPYYTTKANGTGLGLTLAYKIIKEFNGDLQVKSKLGEGTCFSIIIPLPQTETKLIGGTK